MKIQRRFTKPGIDPLDEVRWERRESVIREPDGTVVFEMRDIEAPADWSQVATDILAQKYFRKAGVPQPDGTLGRETSARQVVRRLAGCWTDWGRRYKYFDSDEDAAAFDAELSHMLIHQMAAPNSPQWFNTGLAYAYGITGPAQGHYYVDPDTKELVRAKDSYTHPQPHACFIQSVDDDLVNDNGIMDLWVREARLFKYGSGTGTNFSNLRAEGEKLSGGGTSSGLMSFLRVGDRAAGAIKSGGTTRRAAKMVILDVDHPDVEKFINWKVEEEKKVAALIAAGYPSSYEGEAYSTVSGQNSNNSVRISDKFVDAVRNDSPWDLLWRRDKSVARTVRARDLWDQIGRAAWACADPGIQYDDIINSWHTCPAGGRIRASNPCVTGDTLVATADGLRRIDELVGGSAFVVGADGKPHFVNHVFKTGRKAVYQLRTKAGYELRLTADHKLLTENRGDVKASDLRADDRVILRGSGFGSKQIAADLALGIGIAVGDGYFGHSTISGSKRENIALLMDASESPILERVAEELNKQKSELRAAGSVGRADAMRVTAYSEGTSRLGIGSQPVIDVFKRYAVLDEGSARKRFLPSVYDLDKASVAAVLRGLFTADGTVADYGDKSQYVSLDSTSLELLKQVQLLLLSFGIKAKLYRNRRNGVLESMLPDGKGGSKLYAVQELHSLRISRSSRVLFEQEIGFAEESANSDVLAGVNSTVGSYRDLLSDEIDSILLAGEEDVYDLTERDTSHFVANGLVVHNCSEYLFLDDTACNLASINLMKFYDADKNQFDVDAFRHACRIWTIVLEISVLMAQFPSPEIARKSYEYRTLGLGYANLGTLLMVQGIPYDSPRALAISGAISAILTGESYAASADMASELGPFPRYKENAEHMLRVMRNHRRAAYNVSASEYEDVSVVPMGIDQSLCPPYLLSAARECWDVAVALGEKHGYRNAQSTCIAPTGTIGLVMDCDTTGIEPDFALVKFKKLSGGGYFKIINQSLPMTLRNFGYSDEQIDDIVRYAKGSGSLYGAPYINVETLRARGFTNEDIVNIEKALPTVFEIGFAFNQWTLGEPALQRMGITPEQYNETDFDLLRHLGFSREEIDAANNYICGTMTIEGAPHLKEEHYAAFDCANKCGKLGKRFIHHMGHVRMMAAAQPFISGAISKTINMPNEATVDEIKEAYMRSWDLGLKSIALYRDGSKLSQPLSNKSSDKDSDADRQLALSEEFAKQLEEARKQRAEELRPDEILAAAQRILANATNTDFKRKVAQALERNRLPAKRRGWTQKAKIAGHTVFLRTGEYADGTLGEIFVDLHKEGASFRSLMNCFTGDTQFFDGNSLVTLQSKAGEQVTVTCVDGKRRLARVVEFGEQSVQRVVFKTVGSKRSSFRRTVTVTPNHRWVLEDGSVTTALQVGDRLASAAISPASELDATGFMHGFVFGDGDQHVYYPERYHLRLCGAKDRQHLPALVGMARTVAYPPSLGGDPRLTFISPDVNLKELPDTTQHSKGYIASFIRGWMSADGGSNCRGAELLCTSNQYAAKWFIANAPLYGYSITGVSIDDKPTNFGPRSTPLWRMTARQKMMPYIVESIDELNSRETVYCVVEPTTNTFLLEGGILTGNCFAIAVSIGLQYGVPLDEFVDKFVFTRFEPNGFVDHPNIKHCTSVVDYIFRVLGMEYLSRTDFVQIKPEDKDVDDTHHEDKAHAEFEARVAAQQAADEAAALKTPQSTTSSAAARSPKSSASPSATVDPELAAQLNALRSREAQMASLMGDAPLCDVCGSITRRNGACYVCDSCGRSMGCS
jgi:ribonucleoside-diphosphate reductase alpha chain